MCRLGGNTESMSTAATTTPGEHRADVPGEHGAKLVDRPRKLALCRIPSSVDRHLFGSIQIHFFQFKF